MGADQQAASAGVDARGTVRAGIIDWRNELIDVDAPDWDRIVLLTHVIWWLSWDE